MIFSLVRNACIAQQLCHSFIQSGDPDAVCCLQIKAAVTRILQNACVLTGVPIVPLSRNRPAVSAVDGALPASASRKVFSASHLPRRKTDFIFIALCAAQWKMYFDKIYV